MTARAPTPVMPSIIPVTATRSAVRAMIAPAPAPTVAVTSVVSMLGAKRGKTHESHRRNKRETTDANKVGAWN